MTLSIHPWLLGQAHRIKYLDEALKKMTRYKEVWQTNALEVTAIIEIVLQNKVLIMIK